MSSRNLKIVYMGSAGFAVPALEKLVGAGYGILYVVTQPDKARGRGGRVLPTPVGLCAEKWGLRTLKPESLSGNDEFVRTLAEAGPDLVVVAAYGKILPKAVLKIPSLGCVNIHASLLPEYRGAAPVQRAILDGRRETGVTLMYMAEGLDSGDIISSDKVEILTKDAGELTEVLAGLGAGLLLQEMPRIADGTAPRVRQDETKATYAEKIEKAEGLLDFGRRAEEIALRVRAMTPAPGAYVLKDEKRIGVIKALAIDPDSAGEAYKAYNEAAPGAVLDVSRQGIVVRAGEGAVVIEAVKMPGRKAMPVAEYLKGNVFTEKSL